MVDGGCQIREHIRGAHGVRGGVDSHGSSLEMEEQNEKSDDYG